MTVRPTQIFTRLALWIDPVARHGPGQMACDEALLAVTEMPVMRIFRWAGPWVSAGYFTPMQEASRIRPELPVCRRWTGGGLVVHEGDFTFAIASPKEEPWTALRACESYRTMHRALAAALGECGIAVTLSPGAAGPAQECFAAPVAHDLLYEGRKIAGGAQRRTKRGLLHQGSVQMDLGPGAPQILAAHLAAHVTEWRVPDNFELEVDCLAEEKYTRPDFCGPPQTLYNGSCHGKYR